MISNLITSLLGGCAAAFLTQYLVTWKERKKSKRELNYLVLQIAFVLDRFAVECASFIEDSEKYSGSQGAIGKAWYRLPELAAYPQAGDYSIVDAELLTHVLSFRLRIEAGNNSIQFAQEIYDQYAALDESCDEYARLGLEAIKLSSALSVRYNLPRFHLERKLWNYAKVLRKREKRYWQETDVLTLPEFEDA